MTGSVGVLVEGYIAPRRGLGYRSRGPERHLCAFAGHLDRAGHHGPIPLTASVEWAASTASPDPCNPARRLTVLRGFLRHLSALDGATEVPPPGLLGPTGHRKPPHVYSDSEIANLLQATATLSPRGGLCPHCYATLFGLLACTGLRISEALALSCADVDLAAGMLTVRAGKRGRTRLVPLHPSALTPLRAYATRREHYGRTPGGGEAFFRTERSDHVSYGAASSTFGVLRRQPGWNVHGRTRTPRIHDLRHRMVVRRMQLWHTAGADVDRKIPVLATYLGHAQVSDEYWYLSAVPELMSSWPTASRTMHDVRQQVRHESAADRLPGARSGLLPAATGGATRRQRAHHRSYRDAFELLFGFTEQRTGKQPSALRLADLDAPLVLDFLDHLQTERGNGARTRNARLAAIHSFMRYASVRDPVSLPIAQRVLAIPAKRFDRPVLGYLTREQIAAILDAPDRGTWSGHRDAVLLATTHNTGARVSEITGLRVRDVLLDRQTAVHLHGKGRKERAIPLWKNTADDLRGWLNRIAPEPDASVFPNRAGAPLSRSGVRNRLERAVAVAEQQCPSLQGQHVPPHTLRHSTAMHLLQSSTDLAVIALWLGHANPATTHQYLEADLAAKEGVLRRLTDPTPAPTRFHPGDRLLAFLDSL